ncbi:LysR family transcriptional regulator [Pelagimonas varians]|uniref:HTH-type transcriptional regulator BenM n=1 Tax=Pelagimonas varians TaxID=696760 RepID=A0A238K138_9RHOB|nr:LysR family transcriptional regulator [Pelagimonas varians]PYG33148.1 DNA-binding transcriptional LysR family regulator [Pelagimonas varians]SMX35822.1 HTH-type transcriptional regulator BenM [Pelagimonas varians]
MDIRQLECFVAVAEELHFRRAGERLGLSQSALSERVSALEHELGARLFFRTTRQVSLTQAGSEFVQDAKRILADIEKSVSNVRHTAESDLRHVRVSGVDEAISMLLPKVLIAFRETDPKVHVQVLEISSSEQHSQELIAHRTDVAFVRTPQEDEFITSQLLHGQPIVVVLADTNPLAGSASLSASDIADQPIVGYPKHARPILHEALWSGFREIGAQPNIVCEIIDKSTLLQFVAQGLGISLVPDWVKNIAPPGVSFVPFEPCKNQIDLYVAFRKAGNSDTVKRFVDTVKATAV